MTLDIKVDGELQSDTFLHGFFQSWDFLSGKFVPVEEEHQGLNHTHPRPWGKCRATNALAKKKAISQSYCNNLPNLSLCLAAASSLDNSIHFMCLSDPEPLVVRSTVSSCINMGTPSAENSRSNSTPVAPFLLAYRRTAANCDGLEGHFSTTKRLCRVGFRNSDYGRDQYLVLLT